MKTLCSALLALSAALLLGCGSADTAGSPAGSTANQTPTVPANQTPPLRTEAQEIAEQPPLARAFRDRVEEYMKVHNEAEGKVPNLKNTDDPQKITDREQALAQMIMTLRAGAQPGVIFTPEVQPYFVKIIRDDFSLRSARDRKALITELPKNMKVDTNTVYPTTIPLATFPPALLRKLPDLPPELEYRIVGRSLILRDVKANLIVDILRDVVPTIPS
jgi:hypothetical protein